MTHTDWAAWHESYAREGSGLADRLASVRDQIRRRLDETAPAPIRVISACAGDGRDLLGVLAERSDADRVSGLLVEYDAGLAERAREAVQRLDVRLEVRQADAAQSDVYAEAVPADLLLLCGIFGNITDDDIERTIRAAPRLCAPGAEVVWTRLRTEDDDLTSTIRAWFTAAGFEEVAFVAPESAHWSVGVHRLSRAPAPLLPGERWFTFFR